MMGEVTPGWRSNQLIATCAGFRPICFATECRASKTRQVLSLLYALQLSPQPFFSATAMRELCGGPDIPRSNLPDNQPPRSGLQGRTPRPSRIETGINSHSVERQSKLYCG